MYQLKKYIDSDLPRKTFMGRKIKQDFYPQPWADANSNLNPGIESQDYLVIWDRNPKKVEKKIGKKIKIISKSVDKLIR